MLIRGERHESNEQDLERDHQTIKSRVLTGYCSLFSSSYSPEFYPVSLEMALEMRFPEEELSLGNRACPLKAFQRRAPAAL